MAIYYGGRYTRVSDVRGPSGFYTLTINGDFVTVYVDQEYDGGGWVCVLANRINTGGMNNLTYYDAVNTCNYRSGGSAVNHMSKLSGLSNYNIWIGLKYWESLGGRATSGQVTVVQFVSPTSGTSLGNTANHSKRYRWKFNTFGSNYGFTSASAISDETGTGTPGMYASHASPGHNLTTYDRDQDSYGTNCSNLYNNNPWWYGACWSGNYFAANGYQDGPYWTGSGSDYHTYGAVYIK